MKDLLIPVVPEPPPLPTKLVRAAQRWHHARCILAGGSIEGVASLCWQAFEKVVIWLVDEGKAALLKRSENTTSEHSMRFHTAVQHYQIIGSRRHTLHALVYRWRKTDGYESFDKKDENDKWIRIDEVLSPSDAEASIAIVGHVLTCCAERDLSGAARVAFKKLLEQPVVALIPEHLLGLVDYAISSNLFSPPVDDSLRFLASYYGNRQQGPDRLKSALVSLLVAHRTVNNIDSRGAEKWIERAIQQYRRIESKDAYRIHHLHRLLAIMRSRRRKYVGARDALRIGSNLVKDSAEFRNAMRSQDNLFQYWAGERTDAVREARLLLQEANDFDKPLITTQRKITLGYLLADNGKVDESKELLEEALLFDLSGSVTVRIKARIHLAKVANMRQEFDKSIRYARMACSEAKTRGLSRYAVRSRRLIEDVEAKILTRGGKSDASEVM